MVPTVTVHVVPGRMHIRGLQEIQQAEVASVVVAVVRHHRGVIACEVHPVTHSLLVHYDGISPERLLKLLAAQHELHSLRGPVRWERHDELHPPATGHLAHVHSGPVVHVVNGHMRVCGVSELRDKNVALMVKQVLQHAPGVTHVAVDRPARMVGVDFNRTATTPDRLLKVLQHQYLLKSLQSHPVHWERHDAAHFKIDTNKALKGAVTFALSELTSEMLGGPIIPAAGILLKLAGHSSPMHVLRDRIRIKVPELVHDAPKRAQVRDALRQLPGVTGLEIHPETGSVVLHFKPNAMKAQQVVRTLRKYECLRHMGPATDKEQWVKELVKEGAVEVAEGMVMPVVHSLLEF